MSGRGRGPVSVASALRRLLEASGLAERVEEASAVGSWSDVVGPAIAAVTTAVRVSNGVLFVTVRSSAWLMELKLMERDILRRLNEPLEEGRIDRIHFLMAEQS